MTRIDPRTIAFAPPGAGLAMAALTGLRIRIPKGDNLPVLYVVDPKEPGRWAAVVTRSDEPVVYEFGDRRLWEAYFGGCPGVSRTVTAEGQRIWMDCPDRCLRYDSACRCFGGSTT